LRATIDWSFSLLGEEEQTLLASLSVFAGGCTLQAAEVVCNPNGELHLALPDGTGSLVDKSLLLRDGDEELRFRMLETIREYALSRLEAAGNAGTIRRRHATYYLALAEEAQPAFHDANQEVWLDRLEKEHDNMRAALDWALQEKEDELALRLSSSLWWFWHVHGHQTEGRRWLDQTLDRGRTVRTPAQVEALDGAAWLAMNQGDLARAETLLQEALTLARELNDEAGMAESLNALGRVAILHGDYERAQTFNEESLDLYLNLNDTWGIAAVMNELGTLALSLGDYDQGQTMVEEALALYRNLGHKRGVGILLFNLGYVAWCQGQYQRARELYEESVDICRDVGEMLMLATGLNELGMVLEFLGEGDRVAPLVTESLELHRELGHQLGLAEWLENQARIAGFRGQPERAARLHGAASALRETIGAPLSPLDEGVHGRDLTSARETLGDAWLPAWEEGKTMTVDQAIEYAMDGSSTSIP
jgi:non-specific serine/threonine protein kinase